ncbi:Uncharacterised protein [Mycobacteroides abscessus subsp. massiliense]|nr:Uncharacterised protein [Mycobacteroides abscessus subsp. massiliense]
MSVGGLVGDPVGGAHALRGLEGVHELDELLGEVGRLIPARIVHIGGHRKVLQAPHSRQETAEPRPHRRRQVLREASAVLAFDLTDCPIHLFM